MKHDFSNQGRYLFMSDKIALTMGKNFLWNRTFFSQNDHNIQMETYFFIIHDGDLCHNESFELL